MRYEALVAEPDATVRGICAFAGIPFEPAMLDYAGAVDVSSKPHQQRLLAPPTTGVRSWREDMAAADVAAFEAVAGDLLRELGYEVPRAGPRRRGRRSRVAWYDARLAAWNASASLAPALAAVAAAAPATLSLRASARRDRGVAMRRPFSERKYVRSVAIPGVYLPSGIRHAIDPSSTRSA